MSGLAFWLDASACSGCKACQVACKDKHDLPLGVRWRRVYEVAGGGWTRRDGAWLNDVVAYNLSVACNHCERPICMEVCPAGAITRRADGIVLLDPERCLGCRYCEWVCPYGAPQYDDALGRMTKCTFCVDEVDQGGTPACVAACTLRALDFGTLEELEARHGPAAEVHPLPDPGLTGPALALTPHAHAARAGEAGAGVANREEVGVPSDAMKERSLVAFTLLAQTAVGMLWAAVVVGSGPGGFGLPGAGALTPVPAILAAVGPLTALAAILSLLHLGSPGNAWRAGANVRRSWLSREIVALGAFGVGWVALMAAVWGRRGGGGTATLQGAVVVALLGAALLYGMSRVYRLRTVPAWNTRLITASFFLTAGSLGGLAGALVGVLTSSQSPPEGGGSALRLLLVAAAALLAAELVLEGAWHRVRRRAARQVDAGLNPPGKGAGPWRYVLLLVAMTPGVLALAGGGLPGGAPFLAVALLAATAAAVMGRAAFYRSHARVGL